jgi:hypothetical protein
MRNPIRALVIAVMMSGMAALPMAAATGKAVGSITQAKSAQMDGAVAVAGATVYAGDSLATDQDGSLRIRTNAGQFYLLPSSAAAVSDASARVTAQVIRGTAGFSSTGTDGFLLATPHAMIHAQTGQQTHGRVTVVNENEAVVTSYHGALTVEADGETYTVPEGTSYRVISQQDAQTQGSTQKPGHRHTALILVALGLAIAGVSIGVAESYTSPSKP